MSLYIIVAAQIQPQSSINIIADNYIIRSPAKQDDRVEEILFYTNLS
jgi:hypothetical protein